MNGVMGDKKKKLKKKKKEIKERQSRNYNRKELAAIGEQLKNFCDFSKIYLIYPDENPKEKEKAMKKIYKAAEKLMLGDGDAVFDLDRLDELEERREILGQEPLFK